MCASWICKLSVCPLLDLFPSILLHVVTAAKEKKCVVCVCVCLCTFGGQSLCFRIGCLQETAPTPLDACKHTHTALTVHPKTCCVPEEQEGKNLLPLSLSSTARISLDCLCVCWYVCLYLYAHVC